MGNFFGTDGIRGEANKFPITPDMALKIGMAASIVFRNSKTKHRFIVGKDTRISGYMLETALTAGLISMGSDVMLTGPFPTPGISFLTGSMRADSGIVISASHNPFFDNGIKLFDRNGFKLPDNVEDTIEEYIENPDLMEEMRVTAERLGKAYKISDAKGRYIVFLKSTFPQNMTLDGMKVALDCANGATYKIAPAVFDELGAGIIATGISPDGYNINDNCGATFPETVRNLVQQKGADVGISYDGDGDRVVMVDEKGEIIDGDEILAILGKYFSETGKLSKGTIVGTVLTNGGLDILLKSIGGNLVRTNVGDRYITERMRNDGFVLGGETSGHIIISDFLTTGDGILASLQVLAIMKKTGTPLSELKKVLVKLPQKSSSFYYKDKKNIDELLGLKGLKEALLKELGETARVIIRYSGTEPKVRVMVEGEDLLLVEKWLDEIDEYLKKELGENETVRS